MFQKVEMNCCGAIEVFVITALWDVVLRFFAMGHVKLLGIEELDWVKALKPYFQEHTVLGAALIAGFAGILAYVPIYAFKHKSFKNIWVFTLWIAFVSAAVGFPMRYSGLFPKLTEHYYNALPTTTTMTSDAFSGVVVAATVKALGVF